jgi:hypothetical protein
VRTVAENESALAVRDEVLNGTLVRVVDLFRGCDCVAPLVVRDDFLQFLRRRQWRGEKEG